MLLYFLVPILLIALIFEDQIGSVLKNFQEIKWTVMVGVTLIFSFTLWGTNLWAKWWIINDHEIIWALGHDGNLSLKELPTLMLNSEIGHFGSSVRFRPSYYFLRFLEIFAWGGNPSLWYFTRILMFAASVIILWYLLGLRFGIVTSFIITLSTFSFTFWRDIFSGLGPAETYAVLGVALYFLGFVKYLVKAQSREHPKQGHLSDWVLMVSGAFMAIGSKENFVLLIVPAGYLLVRELMRRRFSAALFIPSFLIIGSGFLIIIAIALATSKSGTDIYNQTVSISSRLTILIDYIRSTVGRDALLYSVIGILLLHALTYRFRGKQFFRKFAGIILPSLLAVGLALLFVLTQVLYYNGKWPTQARYDFPGILALPFILLVVILTILKVANLFNLRSKAYGILKYILICSFIAVIILNGGFAPLVESARQNRERTSEFTQHAGRIIAECTQNPDVPVVLRSYDPWDFEPTLSVMAFLAAGGVTNPFYLKVSGYSPEDYPPGLLRYLSTLLHDLSLTGGRHGYHSVHPLAELAEEKEHYVVDFSRSTKSPSKNLGRIWYREDIASSEPYQVHMVSLISLNPGNSSGFSLLEGPYPERGMPHKVRWMVAPQATVDFVVDRVDDTPYSLKLRVLTFAAPQHLEVKLNDEPISDEELVSPNKWYSFTSKPVRLHQGRHVLTLEASAFISAKGRRMPFYVLFSELSFLSGLSSDRLE